MTAKGDGLASFDGRGVLVPRTVPGDRVDVVLGSRRKGRFQATVEEFAELGLPRQDSPCCHFGTCGGCRWQDLAYQDQLHLKEGMVRRALASQDLSAADFRPALASPEHLFYRNKMEFSFAEDREGKVALGLHVRHRYNRVFDLEACHLQSESSNRIVDSIRRHANSHNLSAYDLRTHEGLLRFLVIREGKQTGQRLVNLVVSEYPLRAIDDMMGQVAADVPDITTAIITLHTGKAQVAIGQEEHVLWGDGRIVERCSGLDFGVSPGSFFQTNTLQAERLYNVVADLTGDLSGREALDLYCGTGAISLCLARSADRVLGIEQVAAAVEDARINASRNSLENCEFMAARAEDALSEVLADEGPFDLIVVDPPRAGVHARALRALVDGGASALIYVSCNAQSLANDIGVLGEAYAVDVVWPVDLFPQTPHCEVVARLHRRI